MKTVGQLLQQTRMAKKIELEEIAKFTKIRTSFLESIEKDDYLRLPNSAVARGFVANYAQYLGLNIDTIQAMFRRDFSENQYGQIVPRGMVNPVNRLNCWTPKKTIAAVIFLGIFLFMLYLVYQYMVLIGPPSLKLTRPTEVQVVNSETVEVSGKTDPQAVLSVNGQLVVLDNGGNFSFKIPLVPGENKITVQALSKSGKISQIERRVIFKNE